MIVYRLSRVKYKSNLSGKGAAIQGGRWNRKGTEVIYTASSRALAMAEVLVHFSLPNLPDDYYMLVIYVPDHIPVIHINETDLAQGWKQFPYTRDSQGVCDHFFHGDQYGLVRVPSAVVKGDFNYLINPIYPGFGEIRIVDEEQFPFDKRRIF